MRAEIHPSLTWIDLRPLVRADIYGAEKTIKSDQRQNGRIHLLAMAASPANTIRRLTECVAFPEANGGLVCARSDPAVLLLIRFCAFTL